MAWGGREDARIFRLVGAGGEALGRFSPQSLVVGVVAALPSLSEWLAERMIEQRTESPAGWLAEWPVLVPDVYSPLSPERSLETNCIHLR